MTHRTVSAENHKLCSTSSITVPYLALRKKWTMLTPMKKHRIGLNSWKLSHELLTHTQEES